MVSKKSCDGWFYGSLKADSGGDPASGWLPSNYVRAVPVDTPATPMGPTRTNSAKLLKAISSAYTMGPTPKKPSLFSKMNIFSKKTKRGQWQNKTSAPRPPLLPARPAPKRLACCCGDCRHARLASVCNTAELQAALSPDRAPLPCIRNVARQGKAARPTSTPPLPTVDWASGPPRSPNR